jgi:hypothetical protein
VYVTHDADRWSNLDKERFVNNHILHHSADHHKGLLRNPNNSAGLPRLRLEQAFQDTKKLLVDARHPEIVGIAIEKGPTMKNFFNIDAVYEISSRKYPRSRAVALNFVTQNGLQHQI